MYKYASQTHGSFGWHTERTFKTLAGAKKDAREMARGGSTTRVMDKNTGHVYASYKAKRTSNPTSTWFKLDHPHALAVVDNEIQLMSSKKLTNPQKKKFKSFVAKVRRALSK